MSSNWMSIISFLFWSSIVFLIIWRVASPSNKSGGTEYIREEYSNGRSIEVRVDEGIGRENWNCTGDCSGHEAGYDWAERNGITDPSDCGGKSTSFIEGCEAYANQY